jgi:hypothetical protein
MPQSIPVHPAGARHDRERHRLELRGESHGSVQLAAGGGQLT